MNIQDHLIHEPEYFDKADDTFLKYDVEIKKVEHNPFYIPFGDKPTHWEISITPMAAYIEEDGSMDELQPMCDAWLFKMTSYSLAPTIEKFSQHIYDECWTSIKAMELPEIKFLSDDVQFMVKREDIEPKHVYKFMKLNHKSYTNTEDFLRDYDVYKERIYHNFKFMHGIIHGYGGMFLRSFEVPLGRHFLKFLGIEIYTRT